MFELDDYTSLMRVLENEVKIADPLTAWNIARELSLIYVKTKYAGPQSGTIGRLRSMIDYIQKTVPDYSNELSNLIGVVIRKMEDCD